MVENMMLLLMSVEVLLSSSLLLWTNHHCSQSPLSSMMMMMMMIMRMTDPLTRRVVTRMEALYVLGWVVVVSNLFVSRKLSVIVLEES